jgi:eukaryotic-like serine/threonine-protein kinase
VQTRVCTYLQTRVSTHRGPLGRPAVLVQCGRVHARAGDVIAGRYRLRRRLAEGGMGTVWSAHHLQLDAPVAVKFMTGEVAGTASGRARFEREAKAAARLTSPHVVKIHDYGLDDDTPFIVMELLRGESLADRLERERTLSVAAAAAVLAPIAKALKAAHELGIVHRDLKPANVFIARAGDEAVVKILDFGIAKETRTESADDRTESGVLLGSPQHMSPEQARGAEVDARSDLWSLGVLLYQVLTGHRPFAGVNAGDTIAKICGEDPPAPTSVTSALPASADAFFRKALARAPGARFQSVVELWAAFDELVRDTGADPTRAASVPLPPEREDDEPIAPRTEETRENPVSVRAKPVATAAAEPTYGGATLRVAAGERKGRRIVYAALATAALVATAVLWWRWGTTEPPPVTATDSSVPAATPPPSSEGDSPPVATVAPPPPPEPSIPSPATVAPPRRAPPRPVVAPPPPATAAHGDGDNPFFGKK